MTIVLIALGLLPFAFGGLLQWILSMNSYWLPDFVIIPINILFLLLWAALAYLMKPYIKDIKRVLLGLHVIPLVILLLLGIQGLILHQYWPNFFGQLTQIYYLPLVRIGSLLIGWLGTSVFFFFFVAFLLMVLAAFVGCKLRRK